MGRGIQPATSRSIWGRGTTVKTLAHYVDLPHFRHPITELVLRSAGEANGPSPVDLLLELSERGVVRPVTDRKMCNMIGKEIRLM